MATAAEKKKAYEEWKERCRQVQAITDTSLMKSETPVERDMRIKRLLNNYAAFCEYYFPHFLQLRDKTTGEVIRTIHNAPFHNEAARKVRNTPDLKAVFMWPRGHAKSTHLDVFTPLWLTFQPKRLINFMVVVGKSRTMPTDCLEIFKRNWNTTSVSLPTSDSRRTTADGRKVSSRQRAG